MFRRKTQDHRPPLTPVEASIRAVAAGCPPHDAAMTSVPLGTGTNELLRLSSDLDAILAGVGSALTPFISDPQVTDVLVVDGQVWVDCGNGVTKTGTSVGGERDTRVLAGQMAAACGKRLDDACPVVDGTLPGGVRLHAVIPPISASGTLISLRSFPEKTLTLGQMEASGSLHPKVAQILRALVDRRANALVSGATGSGKTTLLAALLSTVSPDQRIVCIEEVAELRPQHPHFVSMQERRANVQGAGEVTLSDLVRAAMRMRPDRIVLGECRGPEVREVLTALNTGHDGGWATVHANTVEDVPARLLALGALANMSAEALSAQVLAALDAVVQTCRRSPSSPAPGDFAVVGSIPNGIGPNSPSPGPLRWVNQIGVFSRESGTLTCRIAAEVSPEGVFTLGSAWPILADKLELSPLAEECLDNSGARR